MGSWVHFRTSSRRAIIAKSIREQIAAQEAIITKATATITAANAALDLLRPQLADEVDPTKIVAGAVVVFKYGKGESVRDLTGTVLAIKAADPAQPKSAPQARVAVGEGFEADVKTIYFADVKKIVEAEASVDVQAN